MRDHLAEGLPSHTWVRTARDRARRLSEDARETVDSLLEDRAGSDESTDGLGRWIRTAGGSLREQWVSELVALATELTGPIWAEVDATEEAAREVMVETLQKRADWSGPFEASDTVSVLVGMRRAQRVMASKGLETARRVLSHPGIGDEIREVVEGNHLTGPTEAWSWLGGFKGVPGFEEPDINGEHVDEDGQVWTLESRHELETGGEGDRFRTLHVYRLKDPPEYLRALVASLWPSWEEQAEQSRRKPPALVRPVYSGLGVALRSLPTRVPIDGRQLQIPGLRPAFAAGQSALRDAMVAATKASPVLAHRLIRSVVQWGTEADLAGEGKEVRVFKEGDHEVVARKNATGVEIVTRTGGLRFFARAIGHTSKKDSVGDIIDIFCGYGAEWDTPRQRGKGPLMHWGGDKSERGKVAIQLTALLLPGVAGAKRDPLHPGDSRLIPTLPLPDLSGLSNRAHPQLCSLDWLALEYLADRRKELVEHGSVEMDWSALASSAGFRRRSPVPAKAVQEWSGETGRPGAQRWVRVEGVEGSMTGRFTLTNEGVEGAALDFIREGEFRRREGQKRGRKRAGSKRDRRK